MKSVNTLIKDIHDVLNKSDRSFADHLSENIVGEVGPRVLQSLNTPEERATLRLSKMGDHCPRSVWASVRTPSIQEPLEAHARFKFLYGHVIEGLTLAIAKETDHEITGEQDAVYVDGIKGHRDCVIDGAIVDIKSINSLGFQKVKAGLVPTDMFLRDYLDQLDGYAVGSLNDPLVRVKDRAFILFVEKTLGHMHLYEHRIRPDHIRQRVAYYKSVVASETPPPCTCKTVSHGESGNLALDTKASYNAFKYACFPHARKFLYAKGPAYLTRIVRMPDVPEVDRNGTVVIN